MSITLQLTLFCGIIGFLCSESVTDPAPSSPHGRYNGAQYLTNGLVVTGGAGLRGLKASWIILVSLEAPSYPHDLRQQIAKVRDSFQPILSKYKVASAISDTWKDRLERMEPISTFSFKTRHRRGLFDAGGSLLHVLFGVATSAEIKKYRTLLMDLKSQNKVILHNIPTLATMVNQSRKYIRENSIRISKIEAHESVVRNFMSHLSRKLKDWEVRLGAAEIQLEMDRVLSALEVLYEEYLKQVDYFRSHRTALEEGRLTEGLLPPQELHGILQLAVQQGYGTVERIEWYYEHLKVEPIWKDGSSLLYHATIPLLDSKQYLFYKIQAFPFAKFNLQCCHGN